MIYNKVTVFFKFLKYWRKASSKKGHGVHSPFLFDFAVNVLNKIEQCEPDNNVVHSFSNQINTKFNRLLSRMAAHYQDHIIHIESFSPQSTGSFSRYGKLFENAGDRDIVVFLAIHASQEAENQWIEIKKNKKLTCSIDLFFAGIVFFKKDFKEKLDLIIRF